MSSRTRLTTRRQNPRARRRRERSENSGPIPRSHRARQRMKLSLRRQPRRQTDASPTEAVSAKPAATPPTPPSLSLTAQPLSQLTGITPALETKLHAQGVTRFFQLAYWTDEERQSMASKLGITPQQIHDQDWSGQAQRRG